MATSSQHLSATMKCTPACLASSMHFLKQANEMHGCISMVYNSQRLNWHPHACSWFAAEHLAWSDACQGEQTMHPSASRVAAGAIGACSCITRQESEQSPSPADQDIAQPVKESVCQHDCQPWTNTKYTCMHHHLTRTHSVNKTRPNWPLLGQTCCQPARNYSSLPVTCMNGQRRITASQAEVMAS